MEEKHEPLFDGDTPESRKRSYEIYAKSRDKHLKRLGEIMDPVEKQEIKPDDEEVTITYHCWAIAAIIIAVILFVIVEKIKLL